MKGLDYSHSRPNLKRVKDLGYGFVVRYLFAPGKGVTKVEATAIRAAGLGLCVVYEEYAGRAREGVASGKEDGKIALAFARAIGFPETKPIFFAVDFNATATQQPVIDAYLCGVASVIGLSRVGVYGSFGVVERCHANSSARWFWQTYAWSAGKVSAHAHLFQYLNGQVIEGMSVDLNESRQFDFGAWEPVVATKPAVKPVVKPVVVFPVVKPVINPPAVKPTFHIMTPAELLQMVKNALKK